MGESKYPRMRNFRQDADLSQADMANLLHINRRTYGAYETGENMWPVDVVVEMAKIFKTSTDYLLNLTDDSKPYRQK